MQLNSTEISELIKQRIAQFNVVSEAHNEGTIVSVSDGIIRVHGLADVQGGDDAEGHDEQPHSAEHDGLALLPWCLSSPLQRPSKNASRTDLIACASCTSRREE